MIEKKGDSVKKILFVTHTLGGGGAENVLVNLLGRLSMDASLDITLLSIVDTGIYRESLPKKIKYKSFIKNPFKFVNKKEKSGSLLIKTNIIVKLFIWIYTLFWRYVPARTLHKIIIKDSYDYEVAFLEGICAKVVSGGNDNTKKYSWIHVDLLKQHKSKYIFSNINDERNVYLKFNNIICVSEYVKQSFLKLFNMDDDGKVIVRYNPIDTNQIIKKAQNKLGDNNMGDDSSAFKICSIGRLNKQKQYIRLVKTMEYLHKKKINAVCYILGEGTDREYLQEYITSKKLESMVHLLGFIENPYPYLNKADLFVCSSIAEGFSTAVSEAVILGIPVVTTRCSGMDEILGESEYGLIVNNDEKDLCLGIEKMIIDKNLYSRYKKAVKKRKTFFDYEKRCNEIRNMFFS